MNGHPVALQPSTPRGKMVNIALPSIDPNSPLILREILQNKERHLDELEKTKFSIMQDNQNAMLTAESKNMMSGNDVSGDSMERLDRESGSGSDEESSFLEQSRVDETEVDDTKSDGEENTSVDIGTVESKEVKRARVENILTSMQHPSSYVDVESMYGLNEIRRQKRKQNIPQQHDSAGAKIRKLEGLPYEDELWSLRNHINAVQSYFRHYDDGMPKQLNGFNNMENIHRLQQAYFARQAEEMQREIIQPSKPSPVPVEEVKEKPRKFTDDRFNIADHVRETVNANRGLSQGVADLDDKELNELITNLKSKIEDAVSVTVDKELAKYFQRKSCSKPKENESNGHKEDAPHKHTHSRTEHRLPELEKKHTTDHSLNHILQMPDRNTSNGFRLAERQSAFELPKLNGSLPELPRPRFPHPPPLGYPPLSFYLPSNLHAPSLYSCPIIPPEQTEALSLVVNTPKKKRTKVTDTRLSPRAARALLHDNVSLAASFDAERSLISSFSQINQNCLPTSVAIPNPGLQHSDILNFYKNQPMCSSPTENERNTPCSSNSPSESGYGYMKNEFFNDSDGFDSMGKHTTDTLTPMHLRKAKLMFFYVRYPSSAIIKVYFPDVQFNKNNTAQLVKWFSNFREFYYIQMEKYARQALAEGCKHTEELVVTTDSELYRVLNLHYNRNNQIEVPENFRSSVQATLREFFIAVKANKDTEPSWKKPIYKVIARMDDVIPEYFKSPNWMDQLSDS